jgi:hypothetical protein
MSAFDDLMQKTSAMTDIPERKMIGAIYGNSGVGKTVLTQQLAQMLRGSGIISYIDYSQGWASLPNHPGLTNRTIRTQFVSYEETLKVIAEAVKKKVPPWDEVTVIVVDEVSSMADWDLAEVVRKRSLRDPSKDPNEAKQPDFNVAGNRLAVEIARLNSLPCHVLYISHERVDEVLGRRVVSPNLAPKASERFKRDLSLLAYMTATMVPSSTGGDKYKRTLQVHGTNLIQAKTRIPNVEAVTTPDVILNAVAKFVGKSEPTDVGVDVEDD